MTLILDLSNNNGFVDFRAVRRYGIKAVYLKATEGLGFDDGTFHARRREAEAAGLRVGAYHFARPNAMDSGVREAEHFARMVGKVGRTGLRPALDLEVSEVGTTARELRIFTRAFVTAVQHLLGAEPLIYSYDSFLAAIGFDRPAGAGLWLASYGRNDGREHPYSIPKPWAHTVAHQFSSNCIVAGCSGKVDLSSAPSLAPFLAHPIIGRPPRIPQHILRRRKHVAAGPGKVVL